MICERKKREVIIKIKNSDWMKASYRLDYGGFEKENMTLPSSINQPAIKNIMR